MTLARLITALPVILPVLAMIALLIWYHWARGDSR